jgi:hypothetical protein
MKKKRFSKVKAVKEAAREHIGQPKNTQVVPNKRKKKLDKISNAEEFEIMRQIMY